MVAKTAGISSETEERMVRRTLSHLANADYRVPSPHIAERLYPLFYEELGDSDPYRLRKQQDNELACALAKTLEPKWKTSSQPLRALVNLALAANVIDYGVGNAFDLERTIDHVMSQQALVDHIDAFEARLADCRKILYLADNAGEIAFDRELIVHGLGARRVTLVVRGGPIINDVTRKDADQVGLSALVPVIDTGVAVPGVAWERSSREFRNAFEQADLIVSKGQGNFETLEHLHDPRIFFVFMIKCRAVSCLSGYPVHTGVAAFGDRFFLTPSHRS